MKLGLGRAQKSARAGFFSINPKKFICLLPLGLADKKREGERFVRTTVS
ncbi:MAG: hypothetical protein AAF593_09340 [Planctomycetota bacterium]